MGWLGLEGRVCVVTGAAGGIGRAIADTLQDAGARVMRLDVVPCDGTFSLCDVTDPHSIAAAVQATEQALGPCDVLVNNAALLRPGALATLTLPEWNAVLAVNLTGYFLVAQAFGRAMRDRGGGSIVHVASISGHEPQPFGGAYSVSKAGVLMLSRTLAVEWGNDGVRSNVVSPAMIETSLSAPIYAEPGMRAARAALVPLRRIAEPEDIAATVAFLASPRSSYMTGQELLLDGGLSRNLLGMIPRPGFDRAATGAPP